MRPYRSMLFVPGHKESWVDKAVRSGADAVILDLEDAVPGAEKAQARQITAASVTRIGVAAGGPGVVVRVNALDTPHFGRDLAAVIRPGLDALLLPKVHSLADVIAFDALARHFEIEAGLDVGTVGLIPSLETAAGHLNVEAIAAGPRVVSLMAAAAKDADISREVGFRWTAEGLETLYLRSKVVLAARGAGLVHVVLGLWQNIQDLDGLREFARANAGLGFGGQVVIHPSHVAVVNQEYGPSEAELARLRAMIEAYDEAAAGGEGAIRFQGEHVDLAHVDHARHVLAAERNNVSNASDPQEEPR